MRRLLPIITVAVLIAGCTGSPDNTGGELDEPTMTQAQALSRVEQLIRDTAGAIEPKPTLELDQKSRNEHSCLDPTDGGSEDRVIVYRGYNLRDVPEDQVAKVAEQVRQQWVRQGHLIETASQDGLNIFGRSRPDDFLLSLQRNGDGSLNLGASSPCVWPNGTPEPAANP